MTSPVRPSVAIHTVLLLDCSTSIEATGLAFPIVASVNAILAELTSQEALVSIVFFNAGIGFWIWRQPARTVKPLSHVVLPIDYGTHLHEAIIAVVDRLAAEYEASHGEANADVELLIFTDGMDSVRQPGKRMDARLALVRARACGFAIRFVTTIPGLAGDLGVNPQETIPIAATPDGVTRGFRQATCQVGPPRREVPSAAPPRAAPRRQDPAAAPTPRRPWWRRWW